MKRLFLYLLLLFLPVLALAETTDRTNTALRSDTVPIRRQTTGAYYNVELENVLKLITKSDVGLAYVENIKHNFGATIDPPVTADSSVGYSTKSIWVRTNGTIYTCSDATVGAAVWNLASGGGGAVASVNGNTGVVVLDAADVGAATAAQGNLAATAVQSSEVGTGANQIPRLDGTGRLPAVDGSLLTNLPAGSGAVDSVNGNTGVVVLTPADIGAATAAQGAKADTALQPTGDGSGLTGITPAQIGAATAAQGALADTALQPADVGTAAAADTGVAIGNVPVLADDGLGNASLGIVGIDLPTGADYKVNGQPLDVGDLTDNGGLLGGGSWGGITGTISAQTDLQGALNAKQAAITATDDLPVTLTPTNYVAATADIKGHLGGLDTKLQALIDAVTAAGIDVTGPSLIRTSPATLAVTTTVDSLGVNFTITDATGVAGATYSLNGGATQALSAAGDVYTATVTGATPNVENTVAIVATDTSAGANTSNQTLTWTYQIPVATLSGGSGAFGTVDVGSTSASQTYTLTNTGLADLIITTSAISGAGAAQFDEVSDTCVGATVPPAGTCAVTATYSPDAAATHSASLQIAHNAAGSPTTVALSGTGQTPVASCSETPFITQTTSTTADFLGVTTGIYYMGFVNTSTTPLELCAYDLYARENGSLAGKTLYIEKWSVIDGTSYLNAKISDITSIDATTLPGTAALTKIVFGSTISIAQNEAVVFTLRETTGATNNIFFSWTGTDVIPNQYFNIWNSAKQPYSTNRTRDIRGGFYGAP